MVTSGGTARLTQAQEADEAGKTAWKMHLVCGWTALGSSTADGEGGFNTGKHGNSGAGRLYTSLDARGRGAVGEAGQEQQPWPGGSAAEFTIWRRLGVATQDTSRRRLGGRRHDEAEKHMKEMVRQRRSPPRKGSWVPVCRWAGGNATQEYLQADMATMVIGFGAASVGQSPRSAGPWPWRSALGRRCCVNNPRACHGTGGRGLAMGKWAWEGRRLVRRMSIPSR